MGGLAICEGGAVMNLEFTGLELVDVFMEGLFSSRCGEW